MRGDGIVAKAARVVDAWDAVDEFALEQAVTELRLALDELRQRERTKVANWRRQRKGENHAV